MIELLAPAGSLPIFYAVINAGADAVYVGGPKYGARAYAKNFSEEELITAINYAHLFKKKVYMTFNILLKDEEFFESLKMLIPFYEAGLDAVIIQDLGLIPYLKEYFPGMEIHASTQMSVSDAAGASFLKEQGVVRVVTSRELSLSEIKNIKDAVNIDIESFIHGALCYSYSGQCLLSSFIGGRSGNRGRCAQPCRMPYKVLDENKKAMTKELDILSLKDLCTIELLPEIIKAGVTSLKIEGRMKQASYAYTVTSIYRKYLDIYLNNPKGEYKVKKEDYDALLNAGNRNGFTEGYYNKHNGKDMVTLSSANHESAKGNIDEAEICTSKKLPIVIDAKFSVGDDAIKVSLKNNKDNVSIVNNIWSRDSITEPALNKAMTRDDFAKQLKKLGNTFFVVEDDEKDLNISIEGDLFVPVSKLNELRRKALYELINNLLQNKKRRFRGEISRIKPHVSSVSDGTAPYLSVGSYENFIPDAFLDKKYVKRIYIELANFNDNTIKLIKHIKDKYDSKEVYLSFPYILRNHNKNKIAKAIESLGSDYFDGILARSLDGYSYARRFKKPIILDQNIYSYSKYTVDYLSSFNLVEGLTVPYELSEYEMSDRARSGSELLLYGYVPAMITANCIHNTYNKCIKNTKLLYIRDKMGFNFSVLNRCAFCENLIFNSAPICLINKPTEFKENFGSYRISFLNENIDEIENILSLYEANILKSNVKAKELSQFTKQHFKKGVE
jgi:putative protease